VKRRVIVMEHCNKKGESKVLPKCTLPLTGVACVDMLITDLCVMEFDRAKSRFVLLEVAPGVTVDEVRAKTPAEILIGRDVKPVAL
jgi:3-oxoacid CoA-transferase subunit B